MISDFSKVCPGQDRSMISMSRFMDNCRGQKLFLIEVKDRKAKVLV